MELYARPRDRRLVRLLELSPAIAGIMAVVIGAAVLTDWNFGNQFANVLFPSQFRMVPLAAIGVIVMGFALWLEWRDDPDRKVSLTAYLLAGLVFTIATATLLEAATGLDFGLKGLLLPHPYENDWRSQGGKIALNSATVFWFESLALFMLDNDRKTAGIKAQLLGIAGFLVATVAVVGYLFGVPDLYSLGGTSGIALPAAITHLILCFGIVMASKNRGLPAILVDDGAAGLLARRIIPAAVIFPLLFGWLRLKGEEQGYFGLYFGVSIYAVADMIAFVVLVGWAVRTVRMTDTARNRLLILEQEARASAEVARTEAEHARAEAERANNTKSEFLAVVSHELRTPLTAVIGYEELLSDEITGPVNEAQKQQLSRIKASAGALLDLIDQILMFARAEVGRERIAVEKVLLDDVVSAAVSFVEPMAAAKKITLAVKIQPGKIQIATDHGKLRQIIVNLLSNAIKFTDKGEVTLRGEERGENLVLDVIDTGMGISSEYIEKVFEPFWQVDQLATRRTGGTGLGLSVSRRLARMLGGDVTVSSTVGEGSRFTLTIPLRFEGKAQPGTTKAAAIAE